jgi:hypothetical protein
MPQSVKPIAQKLMPDAVYRRAAAFWHLRGHFAWTLQMAREHGRPATLLHFGIAPGDDLLCTAVLHELKKRNQKNLWMMSNYPELFSGNHDVDHIVPVDSRVNEYLALRCSRYQHLEYATYDSAIDGSASPTRHIIAELCARAGVTGSVALRPYFHLTPVEKASGAWAGRMIAIQSSGLAGIIPMLNKQWFLERFQQVVDQLKGDFKFVQLGSLGDPPLKNVQDLRGKTSIRETAAVLAHCALFVGNVGFLMHLARAVECPSVVVYGGREAPWQSGYSCNTNLYSAEPCAPCWKWNTCGYDRKCMTRISTEDVVAAIKIRLANADKKLVTDHAEILPGTCDSPSGSTHSRLTPALMNS